MKDWRGNDLEIGSTVVYHTRVGNSSAMTEGIVIALEPRVKIQRTGYNGSDGRGHPDSGISTLNFPGKMTVVSPRSSEGVV